MIIITAATQAEIQPLLVSKNPLTIGEVYPLDEGVFVVITGVGVASTTFHLTRVLVQYPNASVINLGIAGAYSKHVELGSVVVVNADTFADYGADNQGIFLSLFDLNLVEPSNFPFHDGWLKWNHTNDFPFVNSLPKVKGITLGKASGSQAIIDELIRKYSPQIETMECAAVFYTCLQLKTPFLCMRSISNWVEPRNKERWNIPLAITNLCRVAQQCIKSMTENEN